MILKLELELELNVWVVSGELVGWLVAQGLMMTMMMMMMMMRYR